MSANIDRAVIYKGPCDIELALIGGSPTWGLDKKGGRGFDRIAAEEGFATDGVFRIRTPYGASPSIEVYRSAAGKRFLRIPSYGLIQGEDLGPFASERRTAWILLNAGVKAVVVGGTSGTCRDDVRPGSFTVPADFTDPWNGAAIGLPGTEYEASLPRLLPRMLHPFCPEIGRLLEAEARSRPELFPEVHGQDDGVIICRAQGGSFETAAYVQFAARTGLAHLFGDCFLPRLARQLGFHIGYYHLPSNWAEGYTPNGELEGVLDPLYLRWAEPLARLELRVMRQLQVPTTCDCLNLRVVRPPEYMDELSPPVAPGELE